MPALHRIKIAAAERGGYVTTAAVSIQCACNPMKAAAVALIDLGRDPLDKLQGVFEGSQISPMSLASIVKHRIYPKLNFKTPTYSD
jgi:hypothetical protein